MSTYAHGEDDQAHGHEGAEKSECRDALERLYAYLDGELTEARRDAIRAHLSECSPCLEAFDFEAELKLVIARHCRDSVPDQLRMRVAAVLARASQEPPSPSNSGAE